MTSTIDTKYLPLRPKARPFGIINCANFPKFHCNKVFLIYKYIIIWFINLGKKNLQNTSYLLSFLNHCIHFQKGAVWSIHYIYLSDSSTIHIGSFILLHDYVQGSARWIMITWPCNEHPLKPYFYIHVVKLGFTRVYVVFYFCSKT